MSEGPHPSLEGLVPEDEPWWLRQRHCEADSAVHGGTSWRPRRAAGTVAGKCQASKATGRQNERVGHPSQRSKSRSGKCVR